MTSCGHHVEQGHQHRSDGEHLARHRQLHHDRLVADDRPRAGAERLGEEVHDDQSAEDVDAEILDLLVEVEDLAHHEPVDEELAGRPDVGPEQAEERRLVAGAYLSLDQEPEQVTLLEHRRQAVAGRRRRQRNVCNRGCVCGPGGFDPLCERGLLSGASLPSEASTLLRSQVRTGNDFWSECGIRLHLRRRRWLEDDLSGVGEDRQRRRSIGDTVRRPRYLRRRLRWCASAAGSFFRVLAPCSTPSAKSHSSSMPSKVSFQRSGEVSSGSAERHRSASSSHSR